MLKEPGVVACLAALLLSLPDGMATGARGLQGGAEAGAHNATIGGRVVDAMTNQPVIGAQVELVPIRPGLTAGGDPISSPLSETQARSIGLTGPASLVTTDGAFAFANLSAGTYTLAVRHPRYVVGGYLGYSPLGDFGRIQLAKSQHLTSLEVRLLKYPVVRGHVTDETRDPLVGVEVHALRRQLVGGSWHFAEAASTRSDDRGLFRFETLKPGEYVVAVPSTAVSAPETIVASYERAAPGVAEALSQSGALLPTAGAEAVGSLLISYRGPAGFRQHTETVPPATPLWVYPSTFSPSATSPREATLISLAAGAEVTADVALAPVRSFSVSGTVRHGEAGAPRTSVRLLPEWADLLASTRGFEAAVATTDEEGDYRLLGVPPGRYVVTSLVDKNGWSPTPGSPESLATLTVVGPRALAAPTGSTSDPVLSATEYVGISDRDESGISLSLRPGPHVTGRIEIDAGDAIPRDFFARIGLILAPVDSTRSGLVRPTLVDGQGRFTTPAYPPGRYALALRLPGTWRVKSAVGRAGDVYCSGLDMRDTDASDILITLTSRETTVTGEVRVLDVSQAAGVVLSPTVVAFPSDVGGWIDSGMNSQCGKAAVAFDGRFVLSNLTPGDYWIAPIAGGDAVNLADPEFVRRAVILGTLVTVHPGINRIPTFVIHKGPITR
ncbi:MAG TPA: carboxypeptidase-like regulatory domain-containing protein [Acidimicrobiales bacterium]|nr:carboxypeptidase-like regulatory domain-containing protein [Acidimicrobiales bacterium]